MLFNFGYDSSVNKTKNYRSATSKNTGLTIVLLGSSLISLIFFSNLRDPFNTPKFAALALLSAWCLGPLIYSIRNYKNNSKFKIVLVLILAFNLVSFFSALNSNCKYVSFIGEYQRKNGFLTYLFLSVILIYLVVNINSTNIKKIYNFVGLTGLFVGFYGFCQHFGKDFVSWNNPYNSVISSVGNPNFASALMSIFAVIITGYVFDKKNHRVLRISGLILVPFLITTINFSGSRQGLLAYAAGFLTLICIYIYKNYNNIGKFFSIMSLGLIVASILGMLQKGPLVDLLYKPSVTVRGYYWSAGIKMLSQFPFLGVGPDRFGAYFKSVRTADYPLKYGFDITSTNAHNVPIQFFATLGFVGGIIYLFLLLFILIISLKMILKVNSNYQLVTPLFAGWVAFQAQSIISIDNIGLAIWGWILSGSLIGLAIKSHQNSNSPINQSLNVQVGSNLISFAFILITFIFASFLIRGETAMYAQSSLENLQGDQGKQVFKNAADKTLKVPFLDPQYKIETAYSFAYKGYITESENLIEKILLEDPRSQDALALKSTIYESKGDLSNAIDFRLKISKLDPWNAKNYLKIGQLYKQNGDEVGAGEMLNKILSFAPNTPEASQAINELKVN